MIGQRFTLLAFGCTVAVIAASIIFRIQESFTLSNVFLAAALILFLVFSLIQRRIKEDMLVFLSEEFKEREWRYFFTSLISFILIIFTTILSIFIIFLELGLSRTLITVLLGIIILLMMYTVFSMPTVEKTAVYPIFLLFALIFSLIVVGSQLEIGYSLPGDTPTTLKNIADPLFLLNIATISWMASLMAGAEMPHPLSAITGLYERGKSVKEEVALRRNVLYITIIILIGLFVLINLIAVIDFPGGVEVSDFQWGYALIFISIALLVALIFYIIFILPGQGGSIKEKYDVELLNKIIVLSVSSIVAAIFVALAVLTQLGTITSIGPIQLTKKESIDFAIFAILSAIGPFGFYETFLTKKMNNIEERFPEFLRDLAESRKAGMTMTRAVEMAAKGDYGYLTPEIKKMAIQISWGMSFSEALRRFGDRIKTPLVVRTTTMVVKASEAGGKIADVIEAAARNVREIKILQKERKSEMQMYLMIIYISFFVFLAVIIALAGMFLPELVKATESAGSALAGGEGAGISLEEYEFIYICTALSQAVGSGIVAGSLSEGKALPGLRHGTIMVLITYIIFKLLV